MSRNRIIFALVAVAAAFAIALVGAFQVWRGDVARQHAYEARVADQAAGQVMSVMQAHLDTIAGLRGMFDASEYVDNAEFRAYARAILANPALQAISYLRAVTTDEIPAWERETGQRATTKLPHAGPHYLITYLSAPSGGHVAIGFDAASDRLRIDAVTRASVHGQISATPPVALATNRKMGIVLYAPVETRGTTDLVSTMVDADSLTKQVVGVLPDGTGLLITDQSGRTVGGKVADGDPSQTRTVSVGGRQWSVNVWVANGGGNVALPVAIASTGLIVAILGSWIIILSARRHRDTLVQLRRQTDARDRAELGLRVSEKRMKALVREVPIALFHAGASGNIRLANSAWHDLTGIEPDASLGRHWKSVIHPEDLARAREWRARVDAGDDTSAVLRVLRADGQIRFAAVRIVHFGDPLDSETGWLGSMADITALELAKSRTEGIVRAITDGILVTSQEGRVLWSNPSADTIFGARTEDLSDQTIGELLTSEDAEDRRSSPVIDPADLADGVDVVGRRLDGRNIHLHVQSRPHTLGDEDGYTVVLRDLTARDAEEAARRRRSREQNALQEVGIRVARQEPIQDVARTAVEQCCAVFGAVSAVVVRFTAPGQIQVITASSASAAAIPRDGDQKDMNGCLLLASVLNTGAVETMNELPGWWHVDDAPGHSERVVAAPIHATSNVWGALVVRVDGDIDASELGTPARHLASLIGMAVNAWDQRERLAMLAATDELTGLPNRRAFTKHLEVELERADRYGRPLVLAIFDLDHFKAINDTYGHDAGDETLREVARRANGQIRNGEMLARIGGEEFAWIMPETTTDGARVALERMLQAFRGTPFPGVGTVTASVGLADLIDAEATGSLYRAADKALYFAKSSGRDRVCSFEEACNARRPAAIVES